jgi:hypothetical protein
LVVLVLAIAQSNSYGWGSARTICLLVAGGAGAAFPRFSAGIATGAIVAHKLVLRLGARVVPMVGLALATAGMQVLTQLQSSVVLLMLLMLCPTGDV